jgi:hypothetical protein
MPCKALVSLGVIAFFAAFAFAFHSAHTHPPPTALRAPRLVEKNDKSISVLGWLYGGVWITDASQLGSGILRIETRYQWSDNHAFLRFNTHFVTKDGVFKSYDGNFFWNPEQSTLALWYMDASNHITRGAVKMDGDNFQVTFRGADFACRPADLRVTVTRKSPDDYAWLLEEKLPDAWRQLAKLEYRRRPGTEGALSHQPREQTPQSFRSVRWIPYTDGLPQFSRMETHDQYAA